jgi:hypothetical protein
VDNPHRDVWLLNPDVKALMAELWRRGVPRTASYPIAQKYQIALALARQAPFDPGKPPFQDADIVVKLHNALNHFEPDWIIGLAGTAPAEVSPHRFEKTLRGKFALNPLMSAGNPFFPDKCLSHGCAEWAVRSSLKLTDAFYSTMGLPASYEHVHSRLGTS